VLETPVRDSSAIIAKGRTTIIDHQRKEAHLQR